jgi:hypothetical protein
MPSIPSYFDRYGWAYEEIEPGVWRSTFASEAEEDFDLYVLVADEWVHFAVSPLLPHMPDTDMSRLHTTLLHLNQELRLARFGVDDDGDVNLLAELPLARISFATFGQTLELLVYYAGQLAPELRRVAGEPHYHSPLFE